MRTNILRSNNRTILYIIVIAVIVVAFLLLGGGPWISGMTHGHRSMGTSNLIWSQILVSLGIGFVLGLLVARKR